MNRMVPLLCIATALLVLVACGTARRGAPYTTPMPLQTPQLVAGQKVFLENCHQCHPGGESGLGPGLNNKPLPTSLMRLQVRVGMGAMPGFTEQQISDVELDSLLAYLKALRNYREEEVSRKTGQASPAMRPSDARAGSESQRLLQPL